MYELPDERERGDGDREREREEGERSNRARGCGEADEIEIEDSKGFMGFSLSLSLFFSLFRYLRSRVVARRNARGSIAEEERVYPLSVSLSRSGDSTSRFRGEEFGE